MIDDPDDFEDSDLEEAEDNILADPFFKVDPDWFEKFSNQTAAAEPGKIEVTVKSEERGILIEVRDDGAGMDNKILEETQKGNHSGMKNIKERLKMHYGEESDMIITSTPMIGTTIILHLPLKEFNLV